MSSRGKPDHSHKPPRFRLNNEWQDYAACTTANPTIFFDPDRYGEALAVCATCPVRTPCTLLGRSEREGVWGGRIHRSRKKESV